MTISNTERELASSLVNFVNSRGHRIKARVKELKNDSLTFELLASENHVQISEILKDVEVFVEGKMVYRGELWVLALVPMGIMTVCEAKISGSWMLDSFGTDDFIENIDSYLEEHTVNWARDHEISPQFRVSVADLETYLMGLECWCEQVECGALVNRPDGCGREQEILKKLGPIVDREIASHFAEYERVVSTLDKEARSVHREHLMKTVHRFILQSPFSYRCFTKPLGFAGDYGMVRLMLGSPYQGTTLFAKLLNSAFMKTGPVVAHQNRINYLVETLRKVVTRRAAQGLRTRVLNLGCGPAEEVQRFLETESVSETCDFELLDFNPETLSYARQQIAAAQERAGREVKVELIEESIQGFLREASRGDAYSKEGYDFVYCAGLFDYLQQRFCVKLTEVMCGLVGEGGYVVVTNVSKENTIPAVMADFLEWTLVERDREEMLNLAPQDNLTLLKELKSDSTCINFFLELQKSEVRHRDVAKPEEINAAQVDRSGISREIRERGGDRANAQL